MSKIVGMFSKILKKDSTTRNNKVNKVSTPTCSENVSGVPSIERKVINQDRRGQDPVKEFNEKLEQRDIRINDEIASDFIKTITTITDIKDIVKKYQYYNSDENTLKLQLKTAGMDEPYVKKLFNDILAFKLSRMVKENDILNDEVLINIDTTIDILKKENIDFCTLHISRDIDIAFREKIDINLQQEKNQNLESINKIKDAFNNKIIPIIKKVTIDENSFSKSKLAIAKLINKYEKLQRKDSTNKKEPTLPVIKETLAESIFNGIIEANETGSGLTTELTLLIETILGNQAKLEETIELYNYYHETTIHAKIQKALIASNYDKNQIEKWFVIAINKYIADSIKSFGSDIITTNSLNEINKIIDTIVNNNLKFNRDEVNDMFTSAIIKNIKNSLEYPKETLTLNYIEQLKIIYKDNITPILKKTSENEQIFTKSTTEINNLITAKEKQLNDMTPEDEKILAGKVQSIFDNILQYENSETEEKLKENILALYNLLYDQTTSFKSIILVNDYFYTKNNQAKFKNTLVKNEIERMIENSILNNILEYLENHTDEKVSLVSSYKLGNFYAILTSLSSKVDVLKNHNINYDKVYMNNRIRRFISNEIDKEFDIKNRNPVDTQKLKQFMLEIVSPMFDVINENNQKLTTESIESINKLITENADSRAKTQALWNDSIIQYMNNEEKNRNLKKLESNKYVKQLDDIKNIENSLFDYQQSVLNTLNQTKTLFKNINNINNIKKELRIKYKASNVFKKIYTKIKIFFDMEVVSKSTINSLKLLEEKDILEDNHTDNTEKSSAILYEINKHKKTYKDTSFVNAILSNTRILQRQQQTIGFIPEEISIENNILLYKFFNEILVYGTPNTSHREHPLFFKQISARTKVQLEIMQSINYIINAIDQYQQEINDEKKYSNIIFLHAFTEAVDIIVSKNSDDITDLGDLIISEFKNQVTEITSSLKETNISLFNLPLDKIKVSLKNNDDNNSNIKNIPVLEKQSVISVEERIEYTADTAAIHNSLNDIEQEINSATEQQLNKQEKVKLSSIVNRIRRLFRL